MKIRIFFLFLYSFVLFTSYICSTGHIQYNQYTLLKEKNGSLYF